MSDWKCRGTLSVPSFGLGPRTFLAFVKAADAVGAKEATERQFRRRFGRKAMIHIDSAEAGTKFGGLKGSQASIDELVNYEML